MPWNLNSFVQMAEPCYMQFKSQNFLTHLNSNHKSQFKSQISIQLKSQISIQITILNPTQITNLSSNHKSQVYHFAYIMHPPTPRLHPLCRLVMSEYIYILLLISIANLLQSFIWVTMASVPKESDLLKVTCSRRLHITTKGAWPCQRQSVSRSWSATCAP